jgi:acyl-CoA synthetase (AMP-forming)/AMP-acid ligase II
MLDQAITRNPHGEALVLGDRRLTWTKVGAHVARLAAGLVARGIHPGDRIALFLENSIEFPLALWAAARVGAIAVPISHRSQTAEVRYILNQCSAALIVHDFRLGPLLPPPSEVPTVLRRVSIGPFPGSEDFGTLLECDDSCTSAQVGEEDTALIIYTSGTTGRPKGAMITHMNLVHAALTYAHCMQLTAQDRSIVSVPMSHVTGIAALISTVLACASTLIIMPAFKASDFLELAAAERLTHTVLVPAMYNLCLLRSEFDHYDLSAWRVGGYGGAPMPPATIAALARKLPNLGLMNCYGATETVVAVAIMPADETAAHPDRVGRAVPCAELVAMNDAGREVAAGEYGELWIRGPTVVRGYWDDPAATADNFTGGFWHSGDVGSMTAEGLVGIHDRKKDMINRGGYKVFSTEVENALSAHPAVVECAIVAKPCPVLGERVHAFVTLKTPVVSPEELRAFCAEHLSDFKVPESFTLLDSPMPRNANGKLLKRKLRQEAQRLVSNR